MKRKKSQEFDPFHLKVAKQDIEWGNSLNFPWSKKIDQICEDYFGITSFRENQREVINATLSKRDVFVIMPTGAGKSLCYQLPSLVSEGITVVISPLLSLIQDQLMALKSLNISATTISSQCSKEQQKHSYLLLSYEKSDLKLLYVTPEQIVKSKRFE